MARSHGRAVPSSGRIRLWWRQPLSALLDRILGRLALAEHGQGKPVCGLDERPQDGLEDAWIASAAALEQV